MSVEWPSGQEHFYPLVIKLHFHLNSLKQLLLHCPPKWRLCHVGATKT